MAALFYLVARVRAWLPSRRPSVEQLLAAALAAPVTVAPVTVPHCNGTHGPHGCEWCDALADLGTRLRAQERLLAELLHLAADTVTTDPQALAKIRARTAQTKTARTDAPARADQPPTE